MAGQDTSLITEGKAEETNSFGYNDCFTCEALQKYSDVAEGYTTAMSEALVEPMLYLFFALVGLWVVVTGFKFIMLKISAAEVIQDLLGIIVAYALLQGQGTDLIANIYKTSLTVMTGAATVAFSIGPEAPPITEDGLKGLMTAGEIGIRKVLGFSLDTFNAGALNNPLGWLMGILIFIPYCLAIIVYFSKIVVAIFRLMMLGIFAPFLILTFAFGWGRPMAITGVKTLLSSGFILFAASAAFGLLLYGVNTVDLKEALGPGKSLLDADFFVVMALGWLGVALMTEGVGLANSITGSMLSNTAAGIITAGISGSAIATARLGGKALGAGNSYAGVRERFKGNVEGVSQFGKDVGSGLSRIAKVAKPFMPPKGGS